MTIKQTQEKMKNKTSILVLSLFTLMILSLMSVSAATTLVKPVASGNYSTTLIVNCTTTAADCAACRNATVWYNATGGATGTLLTTIANTTADQISFYNSAVSIAALADLSTYNFTCKVDNGTDQSWSAGVSNVVIDNTDPVVSITSENTQISTKRTNIITWTATDATSSVASTAVTITSPDTSRCPTLSYTTASGSVQMIDQQTICAGYYTAAITSTDYAGNSDTDSVQFRVTVPDGKFIGEESIQPISDKGNQDWIIVLIVIAVIGFLIYKNK